MLYKAQTRPHQVGLCRFYIKLFECGSGSRTQAISHQKRHHLRGSISSKGHLMWSVMLGVLVATCHCGECCPLFTTVSFYTAFHSKIFLLLSPFAQKGGSYGCLTLCGFQEYFPEASGKQILGSRICQDAKTQVCPNSVFDRGGGLIKLPQRLLLCIMHFYNRGRSYLLLTSLLIPYSLCRQSGSASALEDVNVCDYGYHFILTKSPNTAYCQSSDWQIISVTILLYKNSSHNSSVLDKTLILTSPG